MEPNIETLPPQRKWVLPVATVVALAVLAGGYWFARGRESTRTLKDGTEITTAPEGKVISGFPAAFLIEDAATEESYRLDYKAGLTQPVLVYVSAKSFTDNITAFRDLFTAGVWAVIKEDVGAPVGFLYAVKEGEEMNATFVAGEDGKVQVTLAYSKK